MVLITTTTLVLLYTHSPLFCNAMEYTVGDDVAWSIPPYPYFYTNWSVSHFFVGSDSLFFDFETGNYNLMQVSAWEYEDCTAENPYQAFLTGPVTVPLINQGMYYFISSIGNYCSIGQKISIAVHQGGSGTAPSPSPSQHAPSPPPDNTMHVPSPGESPGTYEAGSPSPRAPPDILPNSVSVLRAHYWALVLLLVIIWVYIVASS